jgi:ATP/maltotriose-dependent transcriptional regulator MalT
VDEPFVGRLAELAELDRQFVLAAAGQGRVVVLAGPAGGGKTALIGRWLPGRDAAADTVLISGDEAEVSLAGGLLGQLAPPEPSELAAVLAGGRTDPLSAGSAVLALLRDRARAGPLVLVVDDAQWGDELSLRALSFAVRRLHADPVLCVIATRPDGLPRFPPGLVRVAAERGTHLDLAGLDTGEVAALAELTGAGCLPGRAAERLREHTGGIPLHVRELLHDLPGQLLRMPGTSVPAPRSLHTLVVSRLAVCAPDTEALVVAAAVLGGDCELAAIAVARDDLPAILAAAADAVADPALLRRLEPSRLSFWPAYAAALARTGQHAEADRTLRPYEQRAASCARRSALAAASRARGVIHACRRHRDDALAAFDASLAHLDGLGLPLEEAMTRLERGRLLRHIGQRRAAARDIGAARLLFAGLRAQPFLARCNAELGTGPPDGPGPDEDRPPLTARQLLVAQAAAAGKSNREIAGELYISVKTVEFHLGQILARLDLDSRTQIARALAACGTPALPSPPTRLPDARQH